jgi:hypothetical protein
MFLDFGAEDFRGSLSDHPRREMGPDADSTPMAVGEMVDGARGIG